MAQRMGRDIALLFHDHGTRTVSGEQHAPAVLYPREGPGTYYTGGWVGPVVGLNGGKIPPHRDRSSEHPARSSVAIPTELPGPPKSRWD